MEYSFKTVTTNKVVTINVKTLTIAATVVQYFMVFNAQVVISTPPSSEFIAVNDDQYSGSIL
jgi:hypothetical protein